MSDKPGLPLTDEEKATLMVRMIRTALHADTADGRAGLGALLRELRSADPEALQRLADGLRLRHVGPGRSIAH